MEAWACPPWGSLRRWGPRALGGGDSGECIKLKDKKNHEHLVNKRRHHNKNIRWDVMRPVCIFWDSCSFFDFDCPVFWYFAVGSGIFLDSSFLPSELFGIVPCVLFFRIFMWRWRSYENHALPGMLVGDENTEIFAGVYMLIQLAGNRRKWGNVRSKDWGIFN